MDENDIKKLKNVTPIRYPLNSSTNVIVIPIPDQSDSSFNISAGINPTGGDAGFGKNKMKSFNAITFIEDSTNVRTLAGWEMAKLAEDLQKITGAKPELIFQHLQDFKKDKQNPTESSV